MAATITDDELRNRLSSILGSNQTIPPIVDSTRSFLLEKLSQLQCGGELEIISKTNKPSTERVKVCILNKKSLFYQLVLIFATFIYLISILKSCL
jgi:hypothetical protein